MTTREFSIENSRGAGSASENSSNEEFSAARCSLDTRRGARDRPAMWATLLQVALGGALGAVARYLTGAAAIRLLGPGFPWGTLAVNVLGSFLMGVLVVVLAQLSATRLAPFLMTGILGGFTTFSAFSLDALTLWERGQGTLAALYVAASVGLSLAAIAAGLLAARSALT